MLGILLVDKPSGLTSHDVVNDIRRRFGTRRVGHAGTLDPLATGLLVVAVGPATRFLQYLPLEPKVYEANVHFGYSTDTYDLEGEKSEERPVPENLAGAIDAALPALDPRLVMIGRADPASRLSNHRGALCGFFRIHGQTAVSGTGT